MAVASQAVQNPEHYHAKGRRAVNDAKNSFMMAVLTMLGLVSGLLDLATGGTTKTIDREMVTHAPIVELIKGIGAALIVAAMVIVVLSMVFGLDVVQEADGPFGNMTSEFATYGVAALSLVGIGIIVAGANFAMNMFGGRGGMGR
ncbi:hypothetical protein [Natrinema sp. DC36]|uniref:hypothetical protein n=1 Tax=Natrinema sp. DC36 TaxID=2878680 RepID=UPI001CF02D45|nr:hypothetical protein [Natrinema sp. DC36]